MVKTGEEKFLIRKKEGGFINLIDGSLASERHLRNKIITKSEQNILRGKRVCVIGCGGLGGYVIEMLARFGIGQITVVDGDVFNETNLNRQLYCLMPTLGRSKAFTSAERVEAIDPEIRVNVVATFVQEDNVLDIIKGHDVIVDALDSNAARVIVMDACKVSGIPCIHGAIAGWYGQVSTVFPEDVGIRNYLMKANPKGVEMDIGNPSFTPAWIASCQVSQTIKVLLGKAELLREKMMFVDLLEDEVEILEL